VTPEPRDSQSDTPPPSADEGEGEGEQQGDGEDVHGAGDADEGDVAGGPSFALPIALGSSTFAPEYGDVREDRVVLYGGATTQVKEFVYAIKATNVGRYTVPPIQAEAMYDRSVVARGVAGKIEVVGR
jgi:hypothetical protein